MSSNSGAARPFKLVRSVFPPSSTAGSGASLASSTTAELHSRPAHPKAVTKRLLQSDVADHVFEKERLHGVGDLRSHGRSALRYLFQTDVHTYAFSVAANAILSFFPFIVLLLTVTRRVFHSIDMYNVVLEVLRYYLPSNQDFVVHNLQVLANVQGRGQVFSLVMLLITSTGIFLPLEVALNSIWGFKKNRSYVMNQVVALGLALGCGVLFLLSIAATTQNLRYLGLAIGSHALVFRGVEFVLMKITAILPGIGLYFLVYWLLPNGKVPVRAVLPPAIVMGVLTEVAKFLYVLALPWLNFPEVYGPFSISVTLMFWSYINAMLLLLGGFLSASQHTFSQREAR